MKYETLFNFNNNITILLIELSAAMSCDYARLRGFRKIFFSEFSMSETSPTRIHVLSGVMDKYKYKFRENSSGVNY